ncbi:Cleavage and polyadenylation specificity factor subunit 4 [Borealophlyctis nickersoniae]|nr:Cleavage and polyadenylation specificity factor subunit 4 [Borealophlyctis nickersoniae]
MPVSSSIQPTAAAPTYYDFTRVEGDYVFDFEPFIKTELNLDIERERAPTKEVCKYFLKGYCHKGKSCTFKHARNDRTVVCKHWLRGLCKKGELCEFLHEYNLKKMPECWFYAKYGECSNPECMYQHVDPESKVGECIWYARGLCKNGPLCRHKHTRKALCQLYVTGFCPKGDACLFGHPKYEMPNLNPEEPHAAAQTQRDRVQPPERRPFRSLEDVTCFRCNEKGHYANHCPASRRHRDDGHQNMGNQEFIGRPIPTVS